MTPHIELSQAISKQYMGKPDKVLYLNQALFDLYSKVWPQSKIDDTTYEFWGFGNKRTIKPNPEKPLSWPA
jgi:lipopolysaccharide biosynthesis protein